METSNLAQTCFFNALLRETQHWQRLNVNNQDVIAIELPQQQAQLLLPLQFFSALGAHRYKFPSLLLKQNGKAEPLTFSDSLPLLLDAPQVARHYSTAQKQEFASRVLSSYDFVTQVVGSRGDLVQLSSGPLSFIEAEQGLLAGHAFHPAAKSRQQMSPLDVVRFSPEFGARFALNWLKVKRQYVTGADQDNQLEQKLKIVVQQSAADLLPHFDAEHWVIAVHPWQWQYLHVLPAIVQLLERGLIKQLGSVGSEWAPTSSLRALYHPATQYQLKFSLNLKLTNSLRTLSVKECQRGLRLHDAMHTPLARQWQMRHPAFLLMHEPCWVALRDISGNVIEESMYLYRDNATMNAGKETCMLATLTQEPPSQQLDQQQTGSLLACQIRRLAQQRQLAEPDAARLWFSRFVERAIVPLLSAHSELGLVLLAHQQNIVIEFADHVPEKVFFRDCQGTGFSDLGISLFSAHPAGRIYAFMENHWNNQQIGRYLPYYVLINSAFAVISAIACAGFASEQALCQQLSAMLQPLYQRQRDSLCLDIALSATELECKGNFFCYLAGENENTLADPAQIYFKLTNPLSVGSQHAA